MGFYILHPLILSLVLMFRFLSRGVLHPLILSMVLMFLQSWSGMNVLIFKVNKLRLIQKNTLFKRFFQTVEIFSAVGITIDDYVATAVVGIVQLIATAGFYIAK